MCLQISKRHMTGAKRELWYCVRKSGVVKVCEDSAGYVRSMLDSRKVCSRVTEWFKVRVGWHQGFGAEPFLVCNGDGQADV